MNLEGWWFIETNSENVVTASGEILGEMTEGYFLCRLFHPTHARAVEVARMLDWLLFQSKEEYDQYVENASPKGSFDEEDPLSSPEDVESEDGVEYGFFCIDCQEGFERKIAPLPGEAHVRVSCPGCGKMISKDA